MENLSEYIKVDPKRSKLINIEYNAVENREILKQVFENSSGRVNITNSYDVNSGFGLTKEIEKEMAVVHSSSITFSENVKYLQQDVEVSKLFFTYNFIVETENDEVYEILKRIASSDFNDLNDKDRNYAKEVSDYINKKMYPGYKNFIELIYAQSGNSKHLPEKI